MNIDLIGYVGTGLLGITMIPQVYKTFQDKKADDISGVYLVLQITANVLFIVYGYCIGSRPIVISNCIVSFCSISLVYAKHFFKNESSTQPLLSVVN